MSVYGRHREDRSTFSEVGATTVKYGNGTPTVINSNGTWIGSVKTIDDNVTPNFKTRMSQGEVIVNDMLYQETTRANLLGDIVLVHSSVGTVTYHGDFGRLLDRTNGTTLAARATSAGVASAGIATVKAYAALNSADIMGGEVLKDLGSTIGMLRKPFSSAIDLLARMGKNRSRHAGKTARSYAKATANTWLEYRYGWRPLVGDTRTVLKLASKSREEAFSKGRHVVRGTDERTVTFAAQTLQTWLYDGYLTVMINGKSTDSITSQAKAGIIYTLKEASNEAERWARSLGMTSKDIPATIWECIPYSFVADWFFNTGDWLKAIVPNPYVQVLGSWVTTTNIGDRNITGDWFWNPPSGPQLKGLITPHRLYTKTIQRSANPGLPSYPVPKGNLLSALQIADGLSLMSQQIMTGLKSFRH